MPKPRKIAAPAPDPLPSLEELQAAHELRRAECRTTHRHTPAELRECDQAIAVDSRVLEFRKRLIQFFELGWTIHALPEGEFQRALDEIARILGVQAPRAEEAGHLTHGFGMSRTIAVEHHDLVTGEVSIVWEKRARVAAVRAPRAPATKPPGRLQILSDSEVDGPPRALPASA